MRDRSAPVLLAVLLGALLLAHPPAASAEGEPTDPAPATEVAVDDAVLRWGMSNEANNRAPNGSYNFFSAGAATPAAVELSQGEWSAKQGSVAIEKWNGTTYVPATWAGLRTDATGTAISDYRSGRYSGHQYVFSGGTGVVDPAAGTARIAWAGTVSVLFYGGAAFFRIADPELVVTAEGTGVLTGTVSGVGSSREDPGASFEIEPERVTLADLPALDLGEAGFTATPAYDGVRVEVAGTQVTDSFPQSFVTVMDKLGTAPFWYRSGSLLDGAKKALPLSVSLDAADPVQEPPPPTSAPNPAVENTAPPAPTVVRETVTRTVAAPPVAAAPRALPPPAPAALLPATSAGEVRTVLAAAPRADPAGNAGLWWLGGALFVLAAIVLAGAALIPVPAPRRDHA